MEKSLEKILRKYLGDEHEWTAYLTTINKFQNYTPEIRPISLMEKGWKFYFETSKQARKAKEVSNFPKAAFLINFRDNGNAGYLRITGTVQTINNSNIRKEVTLWSHYPVDQFWTGVRDPDFFFAEIIPKRIEFMCPGEWKAKDISKEFFLE